MTQELDISARHNGKWPSKVIYGSPGGFCPGVDRSVSAYDQFVEANPGEVIYSVGEPAHNPYVNNHFRQLGVIFVDSIQKVPDAGKAVFAPHGDTDEDLAIASERGITYVRTECPLVTKVKEEIKRNTADGLITIYYGQLDKNGKHHPETRAAMSAGNVRLITSLEDALSDDLYDQIDDPSKVAFASQTTHNADEAYAIGEALKEIFPEIRLPKKEDICFATKDRQDAAKAVIEKGATKIVVVGDKKTSSNTRSLAAVAVENGADVYTVNDQIELNLNDFYEAESVGIVASASAPKEQIDGVRRFFINNGSEEELIMVADESRIKFKDPKPVLPEFVWIE